MRIFNFKFISLMLVIAALGVAMAGCGSDDRSASSAPVKSSDAAMKGSTGSTGAMKDEKSGDAMKDEKSGAAMKDDDSAMKGDKSDSSMKSDDSTASTGDAMSDDK